MLVPRAWNDCMVYEGHGSVQVCTGEPYDIFPGEFPSEVIPAPGKGLGIERDNEVRVIGPSIERKGVMDSHSAVYSICRPLPRTRVQDAEGVASHYRPC